MKRVRKLLSLLLAAALAAALMGCGSGGNSAAAQTEAAPAETAVESGEENKEEAEAPADADAAAENTEAEAPADADAAAENTEAEAPADADAAIPSDAEVIAEQYTASDLPVEGEYTLFAVRNQGYTVSAQEMDASATMILKEGGSGSMTFGEDSMDISSWSLEGDTITITMLDESTASGQARGGIVELDIYGTGDMLLIFAQEAADTSSYTLLTAEEVQEQIAAAEAASKTRVGAVVDSIDAVAGAHIKYQLRLDSMGAVQEIDAYAKGGSYYASKTTKVAGTESTLVTVIKDGKVYNLYPDKLTGSYVTDLPLSITDKDILLMDSLYSELRTASARTDSSEQEREAEGSTYSADVYPQTEYSPEKVFFFAEDGQLIYCFSAAPLVESASFVGDSFYTVETIDSEVDESLFDISAYTIGE